MYEPASCNQACQKSWFASCVKRLSRGKVDTLECVVIHKAKFAYAKDFVVQEQMLDEQAARARQARLARAAAAQQQQQQQQ